MKRTTGILLLPIIGLVAIGCGDVATKVDETQAALTLQALHGATFNAYDQPGTIMRHNMQSGPTALSAGVLYAGTSGFTTYLAGQLGGGGTGQVELVTTNWPIFDIVGGAADPARNSGVNRVFKGMCGGSPCPTPGGLYAGPPVGDGCNYIFPDNTILRANNGTELWPMQSSCDHHYTWLLWSTTWVSDEQGDSSGGLTALTWPVIWQDAGNNAINKPSYKCPTPAVTLSTATTFTGLQYLINGVGYYRTDATAYLCVGNDAGDLSQNVLVLTKHPSIAGQYVWMLGQNFYKPTTGINNGPRMCNHFTSVQPYPKGPGNALDFDDINNTFTPNGVTALDATPTHLCVLEYNPQVGGSSFPGSMAFAAADHKVAQAVPPGISRTP